MKFSFVKVGVVTCLAAGLFYGTASAETGQTQGLASPSSVVVDQHVNPSFQEINRMLTSAALKYGVPPEVVKAVAEKESSGWKQYDENGEPIITKDGGIGIMQVTNVAGYNVEKLKYDIEYNINKGVEILNSMYNRHDLPKIKGADKRVIENWYFPVMAYNGTKPVNSPLVQATGDVNPNAYQEVVFTLIEKHSFLNGTKLSKFPFSTSDFQYNPNSDENITFLKKEYTVNDTHDSVYFLQTGDSVVVTKEGVNLRPQPNTSQSGSKLSEHTPLIVTGDFLYDPNDTNRFVWFPVKTVDGKTSGYISSAYIKKAEGVPDSNPIPAFTDVAPKYQEAVSYVVSKGVKGMSENTFGTGANIKRVDAAVMVAEVLDLDIEAAPASGFTDVPPRAVKHVNALKAKGITNGKTETTLDSYSEITRGELAIWIQSAFELEKGNGPLAFKDVADRYQTAVSALVHKGVTNGTSETTFGTHDKAKRGDFALFLYRAAQ